MSTKGASNSDECDGISGQNNSTASPNGEWESQPAATCNRQERKKRRVAPSTFNQRFVIYPNDSKPTQSELKEVQTSKERSAELTLNVNMTEEDVRRLVIQHLPKINDFSGCFRFATRDGQGNLYKCPCKLKCNIHQPPQEWNGRNIRKAAKSNRCVYVLSERLAQDLFNRNVPEREETCNSEHNRSDKDSAYDSTKTEGANQYSMDSTSAASNDEETEIFRAVSKSLKRVFTWENAHLPSTSIGGPSLLKKRRTINPNSEPGDAANQMTGCVGRESSYSDTGFNSTLGESTADFSSIETVSAQRNNADTERDDITTVYERHSPLTLMELLENFESDNVLSSPESWLTSNDEPSQARSTDSRESLLDNHRYVTQPLSSESGDENDQNTSGKVQQGSPRFHQREDVLIIPEDCNIKGGKKFVIVVPGALLDYGPTSTNGCKVQFDVDGPVVQCKQLTQHSLQGIVPPRSTPGTVRVFVPVGNVLETAPFEYTGEPSMKTIVDTRVTSPRDLHEMLTLLVGKVGEMTLNSDEGKSGSGENKTENTKSQALSLLHMIVETAAKTNAMNFFDIVFRTPVGRCVFKSCKEESTALEEVARQSGHEELACFLEETHAKYRAVESDSDDEVDWEALAKAAEEYQKRNAGMVEVINERSSSSEGIDDYFGDGESSSCVSLGNLSVIGSHPALEYGITEAVDYLQTETEVGDLKRITPSRSQDKGDTQTWIPFTALPSTSSCPVQGFPLFGRDWECREIVKNLCCTNRGIVLLSGDPGIGKTAVSVHVGHELHSKGWIVQYESCSNFINDQNYILSLLCGPVHHGLDSDSCSVTDNNLAPYQAISEISDYTIVILDDVEKLFVADEKGVMRRKFEALVEAAARNSFVRLLFVSCEKYSFLENLGFCINLGPLCGTAAVKLLKSATEMISLTDVEKIAESCGYKPLVLLMVSRLLCDGKSSEEDVINMYSSLDCNGDNTCDERYLDRHFTMLAEFSLNSVPIETKRIFLNLSLPGRRIMKATDLIPMIWLKDIAVLRHSLVLLDALCLVRYDRPIDQLVLSELAFRYSVHEMTATCSRDLEYCGSGEKADLDKKNVQNDFVFSEEDLGERLEKIVREGVQTKSSEESLEDSSNEKLFDTASEWMNRLSAHQSCALKIPSDISFTSPWIKSCENCRQSVPGTLHDQSNSIAAGSYDDQSYLTSSAISPDIVTSCLETTDFSKNHDPSDPGVPPRSTQENVSGVSHFGREPFLKFPKVDGLHRREHKGSCAAATAIEDVKIVSPDDEGHSLDRNEIWLPSESSNNRRRGSKKWFLVYSLAMLFLVAALVVVTTLSFRTGKDTAMGTKYSNLPGDTLSSNEVNSAVACAANQYKVVDSSGSIWCTDCPTCPEGQEVYPQCGRNISINDQSECRLCKEGKTFSSEEDVWSCMSCGHCANDQVVFQNCTKYSDIVCEKKCQSIDKYYDDNGSCMLCSWCCGDEKDVRVKECQQKLGDASDQVCAFHNRCETTPTVAKQNSSQANERNPVNVTTHPPTKLGIIWVELATAVQFMPSSNIVSTHEDNQLTESPNKQGVHSEATNKADILAPVVLSMIITVLLLLVVIYAIFRVLKGIRGHCGGQDIERLGKGNCRSSEPTVLVSKLPSSDGSLNLSQVFICKDEIKPQSPKKAISLCKKGTTMQTTAKQEGRESKGLLLNKEGSETWNSSNQVLLPLSKLKSVCLASYDRVWKRLDRQSDDKKNPKGCFTEVARLFGFQEEDIWEFEKEFHTRGYGSPTRELLECLETKKPGLTVFEFIKILQLPEVNRNDIVDILNDFIFERLEN